MIENGNGNGVRKNVKADEAAAQHWGLTTHFDGERFAQSALPHFVENVKQIYPPGEIQLVGICAGDGYYERTVAKALQERNFKPHLVVTDLQEASLQSAPRSGQVAPVLADARHLPLVDAQYASIPRLPLSRAMEHYLPDKALEQVITEAARIVRPNELYVAQISSGDPVMLAGFANVLKTVAGKHMRYFPPEEYAAFVRSVGDGNQPYFEPQLAGYADSQPRGAVELARRYLNSQFWQLNEDPLRKRGLQAEQFDAEVSHIKDTEKRLAMAAETGEIRREQAVTLLDETIMDTHGFDGFRGIVVDTVEQHLQRITAGQDTEHLKLIKREGKEDVLIDVQYPVFQLHRNANAVVRQ